MVPATTSRETDEDRRAWGVVDRVARAALRWRVWGPPFVFVLLGVVLWESVTRALKIPRYLIPAPSEVLTVVVANWSTLVRDAGVTLLEAAAGLLVAFASAAGFSLVFTRFAVLERSVMPVLVAFQAVPIIAIAPLLVLWFGNGIAGKIVMAAIICFFPAVINMTRGLRSIDPAALTLMHSLSASPMQILVKLRLPTSVPYVFAALRISATLSVIGAIVAEISGATLGIGFRIVISTYRTDTTMLFGALLFAILLGLAFYGAIAALEKSVLRRRPFSRSL